jgi:serine/threonine protein kinase
MSLSSCPSREQLSDFALGLGDAFDAIAAHLDDCAACEAIVQELEATLGAVVEKLRLAAPEDRYAAESACRKAMALVAARDWQSNSMDGTDDSRAQESSDALAYARPVDDSAALHAGPASASSSTDRFRILRAHAAGSLGKVSVALDQELNREVALKEIQERFADNPDSRARFLLDAEITGGLEHPRHRADLQPGQPRRRPAVLRHALHPRRQPEGCDRALSQEFIHRFHRLHR